MKNTYKALKLSCTVLLIMLSFVACDKDFSTIESDVLGKDNSNFTTDHESIAITAYNKKLSNLRINGLASNLFGFFNDPTFGQTTASIVTQITPTSFNPDFGDNTEIDSIVLNVPYFSKVDADNSPDTSGNEVYTIKDSLYGSAPIKLSVYQNNYFLRDFNPDPNIEDAQNYYSMADISMTGTENFAITESSTINFDTHMGGLIYSDESFVPSSEVIKTTTGEGDAATTTRSAPAFRVFLDHDFWQAAILDKEGDAVLSNANNFNDYFRGLYFKAEAIGGDGNMILLDFGSSDANIVIYYSKDSTVEGERTQGTYTLNFTGNRLNTFINDYSPVSLADGDSDFGDDKLYLKGAAGSMSVIDLFSQEDLEALRKEYRDNDGTGDPIKLINEAQLIIYEDTESLNGPEDYHKYDRLYVYDANNNIPLIDYSIDQRISENIADPVNSLIVHLGQRKEEEGVGFKYKIRITEHLNNLIFRDSTNTKLGLVLSNNVNVTASAPILDSSQGVTQVPATGILTPRGTILYGSNVAPEDEAKKMRLEIFFTDPNE